MLLDKIEEFRTQGTSSLANVMGCDLICLDVLAPQIYYSTTIKHILQLFTVILTKNTVIYCYTFTFGILLLISAFSKNSSMVAQIWEYTKKVN